MLLHRLNQLRKRQLKKQVWHQNQLTLLHRKLKYSYLKKTPTIGVFFGAWGGNRTLNPLRAQDFKSCAYTSSATQAKFLWRCRWESNPCIAVLQTAALPLRHCTIKF